MRKTYFLVCFFAFLLFSKSDGQGAWSYVGTFDGGNCDQPFYFTIGGSGYVGGGRTAVGVYKSDFWEYDPIANIWTQKASYGGGAKSGQITFVINDKAYVGCGQNNSGYQKDFWEYNPTTNTWAGRASLSGPVRYSAAAFALDGNGYVAFGYNGSTLSDVWSYDPNTDSWSQKNNFPGTSRMAIQYFTANGYAYIVNGLQTSTPVNELWQYDPITDTWNSKTSFPGSARYGGAAFVIGNLAYVGTGKDVTGNHFQDFYAYNLLNDTWTTVPAFLGDGRSSPFSFSINNIGYLGIGTNGPTNTPIMLNDVWKFDPTTVGVSEPLTSFNIYFDNAIHSFSIQAGTNLIGKLFKVYNNAGQQVLHTVLNSYEVYFDNYFTTGIYYYSIEDLPGGKVFVR